MIDTITTKAEEITRAFNAKPKEGIKMITELCITSGIEDPAEQIALFFHQQKRNLDLEAVGEFLSGPDESNKRVLEHFTKLMDFKDKPFVQGLRDFLKGFKLPGEAQKIDRLMEAFADRYKKQNPEVIAHEDAAYVLAFQTIILNTDLHNSSIKPENKMTLKGLIGNLRGANKRSGEAERDFNPVFLESIYNDIKAKPFEFNFTKTSPGITIEPSGKEITEVMTSLKSHNSIQEFKVEEPKSWLKKLTGYTANISIEADNGGKISMQVYQPGWFSLKKPTLIIQPLEGKSAENDKASLQLAGKVAASFSSPIKGIKATYSYQVEDMVAACLPKRVQDMTRDKEVKGKFTGAVISHERGSSKGGSMGASV